MDNSLLNAIISSIHRQYPEFAGCQPVVREQGTLQAKTTQPGATAQPGVTYLLTFKNPGKVSTGRESKSLPRTMRVMVSQEGKILKVSTSR